jgi:Zn-dependent M28 family amino/carboxypeptidase
MKRILLAAFLVVLQVPRDPATPLREATDAIAQGATTPDRRAAITDRLKAIGVEFHVEEFVQATRSGANVVVTLPAGTKASSLLLGAHYDRVARGKGAIDNAASCAVLLELIEHLKANPLSNTSITVVFFDLEELGLLGSRAYFQTLSASALPMQAMNFDIFGYGDTLFVTPSKAGGRLEASLQKAAQESGMPVRSFPLAQYPSSDHRSMAAAGVETLGISLIDGMEIDSVINPGAVPPRILSMIHTDADTMDQVREKEMARAVPVIERSIRLLDGQ